MVDEFTAILACIILAGLGVFQLLLAAGVKLGQFVWGGAHKVLPTKLRFASLGVALFYGVCAVILLQREQLLSDEGEGAGEYIVWLLAVLFAFSFMLNVISRSRRERFVMAPIALLLSLLCVIIAAE